MATYQDPYDELRRPVMGRAASINPQTIDMPGIQRTAGPAARYLPPTASPRPQSTAEELAMNRQRLGYADPMSRALARFAQPQRKSILEQQAEGKLRGGFGSPQARRALAEKESAYERRMSRFADLLTAQGIEDARAIGQGRAAEATAGGKVQTAETKGKYDVKKEEIKARQRADEAQLKSETEKYGADAVLKAQLANVEAQERMGIKSDLTDRLKIAADIYKTDYNAMTDVQKTQAKAATDVITAATAAMPKLLETYTLYKGAKNIDPLAMAELEQEINANQFQALGAMTAINGMMKGNRPVAPNVVTPETVTPSGDTTTTTPAPGEGGAGAGGGGGMTDANENGVDDEEEKKLKIAALSDEVKQGMLKDKKVTQKELTDYEVFASEFKKSRAAKYAEVFAGTK